MAKTRGGSKRRTLGDVVAPAYAHLSAAAPDAAGLAGELPRQQRAKTGHLDQRTMAALRHMLVDRKRSLLRRRRGVLADEEHLFADRAADLEDLAATQTAAVLLEGLSKTEAAAIARIDAALERMAKGRYGTCVACQAPIDQKRLRAVPDTCTCSVCAGAGQAHPS
jgi:RNA polymerase-binding transcription factor DksA